MRDSFRLMRGDIDHVMPLTIDAVSRIHFRGGSHIGISRANPTTSTERLDEVIRSLLRLNVSRLITIGGDDTAYSAMSIERRAGGHLHVVHVPKTIDNDLDLPAHVDTFGYQTARHIGVDIVKNLDGGCQDHVALVFRGRDGRKAGHLRWASGKRPAQR